MVDVFYFADKNKDGVVTVEEIAVIETVDEARSRRPTRTATVSSPSRSSSTTG